MKIKIKDNFLNQHDFNYLCNLNLKKISSNEVAVYHNKISNNSIQLNECIDKEALINLNNNYHNKAIEILNELYPEKKDLYEYSEFHIIETGANYKFPIHDDTPNKLLSGVVYLYPEENNGTYFYKNKKGDEKKIIEWKQNRAVFFSRKERNSWHSYEGDGKSNRLALVYNLMTSNIKGVSKIEKKNYFITQARYKLNPYLYRFLKFTI
jgi:hypothetical protein